MPGQSTSEMSTSPHSEGRRVAASLVQDSFLEPWMSRLPPASTEMPWDGS